MKSLIRQIIVVCMFLSIGNAFGFTRGGGGRGFAHEGHEGFRGEGRFGHEGWRGEGRGWHGGYWRNGAWVPAAVAGETALIEGAALASTPEVVPQPYPVYVNQPAPIYPQTVIYENQ